MSTKMTRRQLLKGFLFAGSGLAMGGVLSACAPATPEPPAEKESAAAPAATAPKAADKTVTVRWHMYTGPHGDWAEGRYNDGFRDEYPNIEVKFEPIAGKEYRVKILSMYNSKQLGDAFFCYVVGAGWMAEWAHLGLSQPLDDLVSADNTDLSVFFPSAIKACTFRGDLMALPILDHGSQGMYFYNQDMLDEAGIETPAVDGSNWDMDTIVENATKLQKVEGDKTSVWGWLSMVHYHALNGWLRMFSTDFYNADCTKSNFSSPEVKECMQYIMDFKFKHKVEPMAGEMEGNWRQSFSAGKVALVQGAPAQGAALRAEIDNRFNFGNAWLPPGPKGGRAAVDNSNVMCISSLAKQPAEAYEFLKWITTKESAVQMALQKAGTPGARPDAFEDPRVTEGHPEYALIKMMIEASEPEQVAHNLRGTEILNTIGSMTQNIYLGEVSVDEGCDQMHEAVQEILDKDPI